MTTTTQEITAATGITEEQLERINSLEGDERRDYCMNIAIYSEKKAVEFADYAQRAYAKGEDAVAADHWQTVAKAVAREKFARLAAQAAV